MMENRLLSLENMELLTEKAYAAVQVGQEIMVITNNLGVSVTIYNIEKTHGDLAPLEVFLISFDSETTREEYDKCIAHLDQIAKEK